MVQQEKQPKKDKKVLTLFLLIVPSLLIAMSAAIESIPIRLGFQAVLLFFQLVLFKNLIDEYQGIAY